MTTTNKFGDMLKEMRDPQTPEARVDEIARLFNEFADRENLYASWLSKVGKTPKFERPVMTTPHFLSSPLDVYTFNRITNLTVPTLVTSPTDERAITFDDYAYTNSKAFQVNPSDATQVLTLYSGQSFSVAGVVKWTANATGFRSCRLEGFKSDGTSLGSVPLHTLPSTTGADQVFPISFVVNFSQLKQLAYIKFWVSQNSGGDLVCKQVLLSTFLV